jgi:hypothetical protein
MPSELDEIATYILGRANIPLEPPIDIEALAFVLGVERIVEADLFEDGRLERDSIRTQIYVRQGGSPERRRFTIAHEVAHLVLAHPNRQFVARRLSRGDEERFCDQLAARLLLPWKWTKAAATGRSQSLETARSIASSGGVSLATTVVRLHELADWSCALLRWRMDAGRWRYVSGVGLPMQFRGQVRSAPDTHCLFDSVARRKQTGRLIEVPLVLKGSRVSVPAEVSVRSSAALALAELTTFVAVVSKRRASDGES